MASFARLHTLFIIIIYIHIILFSLNLFCRRSRRLLLFADQLFNEIDALICYVVCRYVFFTLRTGFLTKPRLPYHWPHIAVISYTHKHIKVHTQYYIYSTFRRVDESILKSYQHDIIYSYSILNIVILYITNSHRSIIIIHSYIQHIISIFISCWCHSGFVLFSRLVEPPLH